MNRYNDLLKTMPLNKMKESPYRLSTINNSDERFAGFLAPFLAGAVVSAPFWYLGANNKIQQANNYKYNYIDQYPTYYPYPQDSTTPMYYPYPPYRY